MHFDSGNELRSQGCERLCALLQQITDPMAQGVVGALETALPLLRECWKSARGELRSSTLADVYCRCMSVLSTLSEGAGRFTAWGG